ncbi:hypothetical protein NDU88_000507 [Pleurodeles waltl]|uniref:Uncharacterized protein n=1 Tax=Pleurodeles waltl TaxID=8319 RepID=A0AAV7P122_PLEWA|nr:hypothetical protein NDU88_000507 [Pleurodeles waltl]
MRREALGANGAHRERRDQKEKKKQQSVQEAEKNGQMSQGTHRFALLLLECRISLDPIKPQGKSWHAPGASLSIIGRAATAPDTAGRRFTLAQY